MGVLDRFLNAMKLNDDDGFDDDDFLDDEIDEDYEEERPAKRRIFKKPELEDDFDDYEETPSRKAKAQPKPKVVSQSSRRYLLHPAIRFLQCVQKNPAAWKSV